MADRKTRKPDYWCHPQKDGHPTLYFQGHRLISRAERRGLTCDPHVSTGAARSARGPRTKREQMKRMSRCRAACDIDDETWTVLDLLARDRMATFQELADEAFADLLKKHGRPVGLKAALRQSAGVSAEVVRLKDHMKSPERSSKPAAKKAAKKPKR